MRNYVRFFHAHVLFHWDDGMGGSGDSEFFCVGGTPDDLAENFQYQLSIIGLGTVTVTAIDYETRYWLIDRDNLLNCMKYFPALFWLYGIAKPNQGAFPDPNSQCIQNNPESPRPGGYVDCDGHFRAPPPSEQGTHGRTGGTKITGIWIIIRQDLYFAGFLRGTPIFVKYLLPTPPTFQGATLFSDEATADSTAAKIRKIYKRPDIPVDVVQI
jgi:hypothetical protein